MLKNHKDHEETLEAVEAVVYLFHQVKKSGLKTSDIPDLIEQLRLINGLDAIPDKWITKLHHADIVRQVGEDLAIGCKGDMDNMDQEWWDKYPGF